MRWTVLLVVALVLVVPVSAAALPADGTLTQADTGTTTEGPENASADTAPGARLAGVVGSQGANIDGEVAERAFSVRMQRANGTGAQAAVVAETVTEANATVDELEARLAELRAAREAGNISESTYRARVTVVAGQLGAVRDLANRSATAAEDLPEEALRARGVTAEDARSIGERAAELTGPEIAAIARNITGQRGPPAATPTAGNAGPPNGTGSGPPANDANATNRTTEGNGNAGPPGESGVPPNGSLAGSAPDDADVSNGTARNTSHPNSGATNAGGGAGSTGPGIPVNDTGQNGAQPANGTATSNGSDAATPQPGNGTLGGENRAHEGGTDTRVGAPTTGNDTGADETLTSEPESPDGERTNRSA